MNSELCGGPSQHKRQCPAHGIECFKFRTVHKNRNSRSFSTKPCAENRTRAIDNDSVIEDQPSELTCLAHERSDDDCYTFHLADRKMTRISEKLYFDIIICSTKTKIMADSGATVKILNHDDHVKLVDTPLLP